ncbi:alpha/beta-hydrolase [Myriangium duriaei CBS 260.36]|uniref:triacylglycerol lipase n=1 Tax=Myriangium duriaei CBS 260.36 TaxID=1168546 RepID=A0A9P4J5Z5_9PEZI|nr:alpha/beta-hydrolase [Myriangium duriaei CBS 260.36]
MIMLSPYSLTLVCLLVASLFSAPSEAARRREQRELDANQVILRLDTGPESGDRRSQPRRDLGRREFTLRHVYHHGTHKHPQLHRYLDIPKHARLKVLDDDGQTHIAPQSFSVRSVSMSIQRMVDRTKLNLDQILDLAESHGKPITLPPNAWTVEDIPGPNFTDKATVVNLARMAANSYVMEPGTGDWKDIGGNFNYSDSFGWELDGLRGHIYADKTNSTVVIAIKGTSKALFDGTEPETNDKDNDNLFGSCCCGQGGRFFWKQVCDCMTSMYTCNSTCVEKSLRKKNRYYSAVRDLYHEVTKRYPDADVWATGHSLGGVVSALLGLTYGLPVMTYEAYPDALAASRLGLPVPPGYRIGSHQTRTDLGIYHYGHTADPVFMGSCNSAFSSCTLYGYAMESLCHTGKTCQYDTVNDLGWQVGIATHSILDVIENVLEKYDDVPACEADLDCSDCYKWRFFKSNETSRPPPITSTTTSETATRTEVCKTPGWWTCLDESTTSTVPTTSTSSESTSTCKTPGWWGCLDVTTTTTTTSCTITSTVT